MPIMDTKPDIIKISATYREQVPTSDTEIQ